MFSGQGILPWPIHLGTSCWTSETCPTGQLGANSAPSLFPVFGSQNMFVALKSSKSSTLVLFQKQHFFEWQKLSNSMWFPIGSMYAIYGNIYHQYTPNVSIYIYQHHGSYGFGDNPSPKSRNPQLGTSWPSDGLTGRAHSQQQWHLSPVSWGARWERPFSIAIWWFPKSRGYPQIIFVWWFCPKTIQIYPDIAGTPFSETPIC